MFIELLLWMLVESHLYLYLIEWKTRPCTTVRDSEDILGQYSLQKYLCVWLMGISFLISLNNPIFKNIPRVVCFWYLVIWCICITYLCIFSFLFACLTHGNIIFDLKRVFLKLCNWRKLETSSQIVVNLAEKLCHSTFAERHFVSLSFDIFTFLKSSYWASVVHFELPDYRSFLITREKNNILRRVSARPISVHFKLRLIVIKTCFKGFQKIEYTDWHW